MKLDKRFGLIILVFLLGLLSGCSEEKKDQLVVSGTVEATEINVSTEIGGKIKEILLQEGQAVRQGELMAKIDGTIPALQVQRAEGALNAARETSKQTKTGTRQQLISQARANVEQVDALLKGVKESMENARDNMERIKALLKDGGATTQQFDEAQTRYETARSQFEAYTAQKKSATQQLDLLLSGSTQEAVNIADAGVTQARANLAIAQAELAKTTIYSPLDGVVTAQNFNKGEFVSPGAVLFNVINERDLWVRVYVSEKELPKIKLNQKAEIFIDAYPGKAFEGVVSYISSKAEFTPKSLQTTEERVNMVFAVKIKITKGQEQLKPGLPADVNFIL